MRILVHSRKLILGGALAVMVLALGGAAPANAPEAQAEDAELQIGKETFNELQKRGEIIKSSPLYDVLMPVIEPIMKAAQPRYRHPFKVYLVHEAQPNAFATPGGNIYVVDSLLYFAKNKEQLAGTLCHEVSHTIHQDSMNLLRKEKGIELREAGAAILLGPTAAHVLAIALLGKLHGLSYSREAESQADLTGSDICASAGSNPWGLVWLFQEFKDARTAEIPQLLSDHPNDQNRINALERHFSSNPATFGRFDKNPASATALTVPEDAPVVFLRKERGKS
jgi:predicted Zn-dependent protease